jgi:KDO2-lipid IV(A) lauroyltransferase
MDSKDFTYRAEALLLKVTLAVLRLPGLDRASAIGGWLGRTFGPKLGITRRARRRIARVMPELGEAEIERIVTAMWDNLGRMAFEYAHLEKFTRPEERHRIEVVGAETLRANARAGHGGMMLSGHFGNFELLPVAMRLEGLEGGTIYRPANNPYVDKWTVDMRLANTGAKQLPKGLRGARSASPHSREQVRRHALRPENVGRYRSEAVRPARHDDGGARRARHAHGRAAHPRLHRTPAWG